MCAAPVLWSTAGVVTRHVERATAFELVFWRSLFAFLFVGVALLLLRQPPRFSRPMLVSGAMWGVMFTAFMLALTLTSTANTLVVMSISPLLTTVLARAFLKGDPVPLGTWIAAGAATLGIAWMFASDLNAHTARDLTGMLEVVLGPLWAWLGAGEVPARTTLIGGAIVLGALVVNELITVRRPAA